MLQKNVQKKFVHLIRGKMFFNYCLLIICVRGLKPTEKKDDFQSPFSLGMSNIREKLKEDLKAKIDVLTLDDIKELQAFMEFYPGLLQF